MKLNLVKKHFYNNLVIFSLCNFMNIAQYDFIFKMYPITTTC